MTRRQAVKFGIQLLVTVALIGLLVWRIDLKDHVYLADGLQVEGRIEKPDKSEPIGPDTIVVLINRAGVRQTFTFHDLKKPVEQSVQFGFMSSLRNIDALPFTVGISLMGLLALTTGYRWQLLLEVQEVRLGFWECVKLTFVGFFFDNVMPGAVGGDVVKAYSVARQTHKKAEAVMSVLIDRVVGLLDLAIISAVALLFLRRDQGFAQAAWVVGGFLAAVVGATLVFYSRRVRRILHFDAIIARLPFQHIVQRCDQATFRYRYHKRTVVWALALSVMTQVVAVISIYFTGVGLGVRSGGQLLDIAHYFVYFPVVMMVSAVPVSPGGIGLREWAFTIFFGFAGVPAGMGCALAVVFRATKMLWSIPGAFFLWGRKRVSAKEMQRELEEDESEKREAKSDKQEATS